MSVHVLKLKHRPMRDKRLTTHLFLAARAFGAAGASYTGIRDPVVEDSLRKVCAAWGGEFNVTFSEDWKKIVSKWKSEGKIVHLTMYGVPIQKLISSIKKDPSNKLVIVGGAKVPGEAYSLADWNVSVTSQPHSEVSALAVFLHEFFEGKELEYFFDDAEIRIIPHNHEKR